MFEQQIIRVDINQHSGISKEPYLLCSEDQMLARDFLISLEHPTEICGFRVQGLVCVIFEHP